MKKMRDLELPDSMTAPKKDTYKETKEELLRKLDFYRIMRSKADWAHDQGMMGWGRWKEKNEEYTEKINQIKEKLKKLKKENNH